MTQVSIDLACDSAELNAEPPEGLVQAWARDTGTGEPRYIFELGSDRRGARSGCDCPSCALPLIAVNAARDTWRRRPHFRHPPGAETKSCSILTARLVALRALRELGVLNLPRRRVGARFVGLSGRYHDVSVNAPAEKVRIRDVSFSDRGRATIVLEDGRRLRVKLTGSLAVDDGEIVPTIRIQVDDRLVASMDPMEVRRRLSLELDEQCWVSHWQDEVLQREAREKARQAAEDCFDVECGDDELPADLPPELRRETLLHYEVKRILERAGELTLPDFSVAEHSQDDCQYQVEEWRVAAHRVTVSDVQLESRLGRVIPDIRCTVAESALGKLSPLLIEVTVTNAIGDERIRRLKATGCAALEIDLRRAAGSVTRAELARLVVDEIALKTWLHVPAEEQRRAELRMSLVKKVAPNQSTGGMATPRGSSEILPPGASADGTLMPLRDAAEAYLRAVERLALARSGTRGKNSNAHLRHLEGELSHAQLALAANGFPEVSDARLDDMHGIIPCVLSIKGNHGVGYSYADAFSVLNAIFQTTGARQWEVTIYLIAFAAYKPAMSVAQQTKVEAWSCLARDSISRGEDQYLRPRTFDRLLSMLFPEMAQALAAPRLHLKAQ